jgi:hypothetical protein
MLERRLALGDDGSAAVRHYAAAAATAAATAAAAARPRGQRSNSSHCRTRNAHISTQSQHCYPDVCVQLVAVAVAWTNASLASLTHHHML